ncbi:hypothetical protein ABMC89_18905 [Sulfitobacter sp. HNIBRBA3233]|uniref:hypothetical protein n=1 Tax=Sulfitobacter marinivivus TaxID=3158558 RepID=UPI0032DF5742
MRLSAITGKQSAVAHDAPYANVWRSVVAGATGLGLALGGTAVAEAGPCEVRVTDLAQNTTSDASARAGEASALAQAALLFSRVSVAEIEAQLRGIAPGDAREVTDLFQGADARWRFERPLEGGGDPDGFAVAPQQTRWLIRPAEGSPVTALLLAGLPDPAAVDAVARPVLVGLHHAGAATHVFTIEPVDPAQCLWRAGRVTDWIDEILRR